MKVRVPTRSLAFATLLLVATMALAQPSAPPPDGGPAGARPLREGRSGTLRGGTTGRTAEVGPLMEALDANHDGVLSAEEIRKAPESLQALDRDRDGRIDRSEMRPRVADRGGPAGPTRRGSAGAGGFGPGGAGGFGPEGFGPPPGGPDGFGPGGMGRMGRAPELGDVLPPFVRSELSLDGQQTKRLQALESDVRTRLGAILTLHQMGQCQDALRRGPVGGPGGGPRRGPGGPQDDDGPPIRPGRPE